MALTAAQLETFRTALLAETDPSVVAALAEGSFGAATDWYNAPATPEFKVWKTRLELEEITSNGFDWVRVDNLSVGKARIWEWMFGAESKSINPSKDNIRAGIAEVWKGTAADLAVQATVLAHCKRSATRVEKMFASGLGTTAEPAKMTFEGLLHWHEVRAAFELGAP